MGDIDILNPRNGFCWMIIDYYLKERRIGKMVGLREKERMIEVEFGCYISYWNQILELEIKSFMEV